MLQRCNFNIIHLLDDAQYSLAATHLTSVSIYTDFVSTEYNRASLIFCSKEERKVPEVLRQLGGIWFVSLYRIFSGNQSSTYQAQWKIIIFLNSQINFLP